MDERRSREAWRVLRIQAELVDGIEHLATIGPSVTIYGSARLGPDSIYYGQAKELARRFGDAGLNVLTGGGPGIMEGANEGAFGTDGCSIGLNIKLPHEQGANRFQDLGLDFRYFFVRKLMFVKHAVGFVETEILKAVGALFMRQLDVQTNGATINTECTLVGTLHDAGSTASEHIQAVITKATRQLLRLTIVNRIRPQPGATINGD